MSLAVYMFVYMHTLLSKKKTHICVKHPWNICKSDHALKPQGKFLLTPRIRNTMDRKKRSH